MATGFELPIIPAQIPQMPVVVTPADIQALIDKMANAGYEGFVKNQDIMKRATVGTSGAEAEKAKNEAATATARQDVIEQQGVQPKQSFIGKIFGGSPVGKSPAPAASPATGGQQSGLQHLSTEELMKIAGGGGYTFGP